MRGWIAVFALIVTMLSPRASRAESARVLVATLEVQKEPGTERCVDKPALAAAVEARLGRKAFDVRTPPDLVVRLHLTRPEQKQWRGDILLLDVNGNELGRRELSTKASDCSALDASLALVVALLVDAPPNLPPPPPEASPAGPAEPPPAPVPQPEPPKASRLELPRDTYAPREPWRIGIRASALGVIGVAPRPLFGGALGLGFRPPRLPEFRLSGQFLPATRVEFEPGQGAKLSLLRLGVLVCPLEHAANAFSFALCLGQQIGWMQVEGYGFDENLSSGELAYALEAGGNAFWQLVPGFGPWVSVGLEVPLVRNTYFSGTGADGRQEFFQAKPVAGSAQIGLGIEF